MGEPTAARAAPENNKKLMLSVQNEMPGSHDVHRDVFSMCSCRKARRNDTGLDDSSPSFVVFHQRKESQEKYADSQGSAIIVG